MNASEERAAVVETLLKLSPLYKSMPRHEDGKRAPIRCCLIQVVQIDELYYLYTKDSMYMGTWNDIDLLVVSRREIRLCIEDKEYSDFYSRGYLSDSCTFENPNPGGEFSSVLISREEFNNKETKENEG